MSQLIRSTLTDHYRAVYYYGISVIVPDFSFKIRITDLPLGITLPGFVPTFFFLLGRVSALSRLPLIFQFKQESCERSRLKKKKHRLNQSIQYLILFS
jgi:hypothetical protein